MARTSTDTQTWLQGSLAIRTQSYSPCPTETVPYWTVMQVCAVTLHSNHRSNQSQCVCRRDTIDTANT